MGPLFCQKSYTHNNLFGTNADLLQIGKLLVLSRSHRTNGTELSCTGQDLNPVQFSSVHFRYCDVNTKTALITAVLEHLTTPYMSS